MITKATSQAENWYINDVMRGFYAPSTGAVSGLSANTTAAEAGTRAQYVNSTGFTVVGGLSASQTYIYIAIRRGPMKIPTLGTSVFSPQTYTGTGAARTIDTSQTYLDSYIVNRLPGSGDNHNWLSRLTASNALVTNLPGAQGSVGSINWASQDLAFTGSNYNTNESAVNYVAWTLKRAPSFFDTVAFTQSISTGTQTVNHNLGVAPELAILKTRSVSDGWKVGSSLVSGYSNLNGVIAFSGTSPVNTLTSTTFGFNTGAHGYSIGTTYIAQLFATCAGVSKVGTYSGTGTTQQINCGFSTGARLVLIKRTNEVAGNSGPWYMWDSARGIVAGNDPYLLLNSTDAEVTNTDYVDTYSAGFEISSTAPAEINASGSTFIFLAIA
jgi:hypothetical protein